MIPLAWRTGGERGIKSSEIEGYLRTKVGSSTLASWGRSANIVAFTDLQDGTYDSIAHSFTFARVILHSHPYMSSETVSGLSLHLVRST